MGHIILGEKGRWNDAQIEQTKLLATICRPTKWSQAGMTSFWTRFLVKEKLVNLCRTHEQIKLVKENTFVCAGLKKRIMIASMMAYFILDRQSAKV